MPTAPLFPSFADDARLWVHVTDRPLAPDEQTMLKQAVRRFIDDWSTHGRTVRGAIEVRDRRFLLLAATVEDGTISGCGIDASAHALEDIAQRIGFGWMPALHVVYRDDDGTVQSCSRPAFRSEVETGSVTAATPVFDPSVTQVGALREDGAFERPAGTSWHRRAFNLSDAA